MTKNYQERRERITKLVGEGLSHSAIAERLGMSPSSLTQLLWRMDLKVKDRSRLGTIGIAA